MLVPISGRSLRRSRRLQVAPGRGMPARAPGRHRRLLQWRWRGDPGCGRAGRGPRGLPVDPVPDELRRSHLADAAGAHPPLPRPAAQPHHDPDPGLRLAAGPHARPCRADGAGPFRALRTGHHRRTATLRQPRLAGSGGQLRTGRAIPRGAGLTGFRDSPGLVEGRLDRSARHCTPAGPGFRGKPGRPGGMGPLTAEFARRCTRRSGIISRRKAPISHGICANRQAP